MFKHKDIVKSTEVKFDMLEKIFNVAHNNKYRYDRTEIKNMSSKILIECLLHGEFYQLIGDHIKGHGCAKCARDEATIRQKLTMDSFLCKANIHYGNKYDYSKVVFGKTNKIPIEVICKEHGSFFPTPLNHMRGKAKCSRCNNDRVGYWNYSSWEEAGLKSKQFTGFKLYIVECWDKNERFLKVGKTYTPIGRRMNSAIMPYEYKVLKIKEGSAKYISELEQSLHKRFKRHSYTPKIYFAGCTECFKKEG